MFQEGELIYFTPFYFKNGNTSKNKYFIILKIIGDNTLLASLPTSNNIAPSLVDKQHGCINLDDRCYNCYLFEANRPICTNSFAFERQTHIYGNEVEDYEVTNFISIYGIEGVDFKRIGMLTETEYNSLIECLKSSDSVKRKIKKIL